MTPADAYQIGSDDIVVTSITQAEILLYIMLSRRMEPRLRAKEGNIKTKRWNTMTLTRYSCLLGKSKLFTLNQRSLSSISGIKSPIYTDKSKTPGLSRNSISIGGFADSTVPALPRVRKWLWNCDRNLHGAIIVWQEELQALCLHPQQTKDHKSGAA